MSRKRQSIADLEKLAEREAVTAQFLYPSNTEQAVLAAFHAAILFGAVDELRRRHGHDWTQP